jgi:hypothetical protein
VATPQIVKEQCQERSQDLLGKCLGSTPPSTNPRNRESVRAVGTNGGKSSSLFPASQMNIQTILNHYPLAQFQQSRAGIPACRFTGHSCPVFHSRLTSTS